MFHLEQKVIPKTTITDYYFLKNEINKERIFKMDTRAARKHFHDKFHNETAETPKISLQNVLVKQGLIKAFKEKYKDAKFLMQKERINELNSLFDHTVAQMTTFRDILVRIQVFN
jgi:hypothetical protein